MGRKTTVWIFQKTNQRNLTREKQLYGYFKRQTSEISHEKNNCMDISRDKPVKYHTRKTTVWIFQATNKRNLSREDLVMAKKGNLTRETKSLLITVQNNAIRTNY